LEFRHLFILIIQENRLTGGKKKNFIQKILQGYIRRYKMCIEEDIKILN